MDTDISVDHLADSEVDTHRHQRNCFVLAQVFRHHQEAPHLAERVAHGAVERRLREDLASFFDIKLRKIIGVAEAVHDPFVRRFEQRIVEGFKRCAGQSVAFVQDELESAG